MLLAVDTSSPAIVAAVHDGTGVVGEAARTGAQAHGELLADVPHRPGSLGDLRQEPHAHRPGLLLAPPLRASAPVARRSSRPAPGPPPPGPADQDFLPASSDRIHFTSCLASASLMATALGGMAKPETLPFQWLS